MQRGLVLSESIPIGVGRYYGYKVH